MICIFLLNLGNKGKLLRCISHFLNGRTIYVNTPDDERKKYELSHDVPKGSVLNPTLLTAVMAHLPCQVPSFFLLFPCMLTISAFGFPIRPIMAIQHQPQHCMIIVEASLKERGMDLSSPKLAVLLFTFKRFSGFFSSIRAQAIRIV